MAPTNSIPARPDYTGWLAARAVDDTDQKPLVSNGAAGPCLCDPAEATSPTFRPTIYQPHFSGVSLLS